VVTAQKRAEPLKDIPFTISALSGETLERRNITDAQSLSFAVPGLGAYQISPGQNLISIRGVSTFRGESSLVGLYLDDIPIAGGVRLGTGSGLDVSTNDLSRIEVLKGPQGTLFGEGSIGGVIRYITNDPVLDKVEGRARASYFSTRSGDGSVETQGVVNIPLVADKLGLRIAAEHNRYGGWIDNVTSGESNYNDASTTDARIKALFVPSDNLKISALANIHRLRADGSNIVDVEPFDASLFRQAIGSLPTGQNVSTKQSNDFNIYNLNVFCGVPRYVA
jgi:outer membrane receptor protein involved in Fe transport